MAGRKRTNQTSTPWYRPPESYRSQDPEKRARQLANLKYGHGMKGKSKKALHAKSPEGDPFHESFKADPIGFIERHYYVETKAPIVLEPWQKTEILEPLFAVDDAGRRRYTLALLGMPKKNGKSTMAAAIALWFLLHDEDSGEIILTANSRDQSSWIIYDKLQKSINMNERIREWCRVTDEYIINERNQSVVRILAPNFRTGAGSNASLTIFDELWGYDYDTARKFWNELTTSPARKSPLSLIVTYAGYDEESLLFELYNKGLEGKDPRMFFYWIHENRASWVTPEYLESQRLRLKPNAYLRLHENRWTESEEAFIDIEDWDRCVDPDHRPLLSDKGVRVWVGVDASISGDSTAVVAVARHDNRVNLVAHRKWQPSKKDPIDLEQTVEAYVEELSRRFTVHEVRYDPYQLHRSAMTLKKKGLRMEEFPQTTDRLTEMSQNLFDLIKGGNLVLYRDADLRRHAQVATAKETPRGWRIVKDKRAMKIDLIIALGMAALAVTKRPHVRPGIRL